MDKPRTKTRNLAINIRPDEGDIPVGSAGFAPFSGPFVCQSRSGYWRPRHEFNPDDGRCLYCDQWQGHRP